MNDAQKAKASGATHYFTNDRGITFYGRFVNGGVGNLRHFFCLCKDQTTWMAEPVTVANARAIDPKTFPHVKVKP